MCGEFHMFSPFVCAEFIWVILQVEEGGVLAVTQLLSQFGADFASSAGVRNEHIYRPSVHADNPFVLTPYPSNSFTDGDVGMGSDMLLPVTTCVGGTRHSSLPSSPRWLGDDRNGTLSVGALPIPDEPLRARTVLFQVCKVLIFQKKLS
jgi:hypothetical protein